MTVGELAKKMNTTVRTLQYYHKEGLLSPSAESEGGRRLYTDKDVVQLLQIQSMKFLGFSLNDIKHQLVALDTPADVAAMLTSQMEAVRANIASLTNVLQALEKLQAETLQMETVDWVKYADIVVNLQMKNEFYGAVKHFDEKTLDHLHKRFDLEGGTAVMNTMDQLLNKAVSCQNSGIAPASEQGQAIAKAWWDMVMEVTGGDMSLLPNLTKSAKDAGNEKWNEQWGLAESYIAQAMEIYFTNQNRNPLEGVEL